MLYVIETTTAGGNVVGFHACENGIDEAIGWIGSRCTESEGDVRTAEDVAAERWASAVRKGEYWGTDACQYFTMRGPGDLVRFGLFTTGLTERV